MTNLADKYINHNMRKCDICNNDIIIDCEKGYKDGFHYLAICKICGKEYPLRSTDRQNAIKEWNNYDKSKITSS